MAFHQCGFACASLGLLVFEISSHRLNMWEHPPLNAHIVCDFLCVSSICISTLHLHAWIFCEDSCHQHRQTLDHILGMDKFYLCGELFRDF